ncbi:MAG TPA: serine/threonine-protein kinase [bacterium]|nr:serine/threonine-protein kinase [bacterium]
MDSQHDYTVKLIGKTLEGYMVEEKIWQGATSTVYKCTDTNGNGDYGNVVALKVLHPYRREPYQVKMFIREAKILRKFEHKNIVKAYSLGKTGISMYILMEYISGKDLKGFSQNGIPPDKEFFEMFRDIADAIDFIHSRKIIHNDIKPENILFDPSSSSFKLIDFGYARPVRKWFNRKDYSGGTDRYMAPERTKGFFDERSDIYSFGIVMEEFLLQKVKHRIIESIVYKATQKDPEKRYSSFSDMISDMKYYIYQ